MATPKKSARVVKARRGGSMACQRPRVNSQWSVWYCVLALALQVYIIATSIQRFTRYVSLPWPPQGQPYFELNAYVAFIGAAVVLLPFFVLSALMKVGNYANDGHKLGDEEPDMVVYQNLRRRKCFRWVKAVWKHGGPIAPLLHLAAAMCLLLPRLLIQAQLIKHGFLSKGAIWRTDLDFILTHKERLVTLRFLATLNETEVWGQEGDEPQRPLLRPEVQLEEGVLISSEFINYTLALLVHAVRYPAVFWRVNKCFGLIFSGHLLLTSVQQLLAYTGFAVLYRVHVCGPRDVLLRFSPLLLSVRVAVLLFLLYSAVLTVSGSALYVYGLQKYREWLDSRTQCQLIRWRQESRRLWGVAPHLGAFFMLLAIALCAGPLMYDYTLVYCGSLDGAVLAGVTGTIVHLFLWIVLWLALTIKHRWVFNSSVSVDLQLNGFKGGQEAPLLVIDHGQTYQVREKESKKAILTVVHKSMASIQKTLSPTEDDDIYWLKPKPPPPKETKPSPETDRIAWLRSQRKSPGPKHKVIFQDGLMSSTGTCRRTRSLKKSPKIVGRFKKQNVKFEELSDSDDGDYATLRDMTVVREEGDGEDDHIRQRQLPLGGAEDTADGVLDDGDYENLLEESPTSGQLRVPVAVHRQPLGSTRSTDSGITKEVNGDVTPRSGSISESSTSPEKGSSESSSGVHSTASLGDKRASSMENIGQGTLQRPTWKSMSLQRTAVPPVERGPRLVMLKDDHTVPRVFRSSSGNNTVVIHRKAKRAKESSVTSAAEPFGRATNIRMTSFTDQPDFPTTVVNIASPKSPPLSPQHSSCSMLSGVVPHSHFATPMGTTPVGSVATVAPHHSNHQRRDSANYSLASSAESDTSAPHS